MGLLFPLFLAVLAGTCQGARYLHVRNSWSNLEFTFPNKAARQAMIQQGYYIPGAALPIDVDMHNDRVFMTMPRLAPGIPATLTTLSTTQGNIQSPTLDPYPDWSWHRQGQCNGITSVFRVQIDECGRLWVLDTGSVDIFAGIKHICPKQLLIFNLANDKLVTRHRFAQSIIKPDTILTTIVVDVRDPKQKCRSSFAYIADVSTYAIIVYDSHQDKSWRITANSFYPIPYFGHFDILGSEFDLMDGILGLALSPQSQNPRTLYYHSLASNTESFVSTAILKNESLFTDGVNSVQKQFFTYPNTRVAQAAAQAVASNGVLFFSELTKASLVCWNTRNEYGGHNLVEVDKDYEHFQFAAGMKVIKNRQGVEEVWALTDRLQRSAAGTLDKNDVNFRILTAPVQQLIAGTKCAAGGNHDNSGENFINRPPGTSRPGGGHRPTRPGHHHHQQGGVRPYISDSDTGTTTVRVAAVNNDGPITFKKDD